MTSATRRPMGPCPLPECYGAEHVHTMDGAPHRWGDASIEIRYDGRSPAAAVEMVYRPKRGPERIAGAWPDPNDAADWLEKVARKIRSAYVPAEAAA